MHCSIRDQLCLVKAAYRNGGDTPPAVPCGLGRSLLYIQIDVSHVILHKGL